MGPVRDGGNIATFSRLLWLAVGRKPLPSLSQRRARSFARIRGVGVCVCVCACDTQALLLCAHLPSGCVSMAVDLGGSFGLSISDQSNQHSFRNA